MHVENGRKRVERVAWQAVPADTAESGSLDHGEERGWKRKETRGVNIEISPSSSFFFPPLRKKHIERRNSERGEEETRSRKRKTKEKRKRGRKSWVRVRERGGEGYPRTWVTNLYEFAWFIGRKFNNDRPDPPFPSPEKGGVVREWLPIAEFMTPSYGSLHLQVTRRSSIQILDTVGQSLIRPEYIQAFVSNMYCIINVLCGHGLQQTFIFPRSRETPSAGGVHSERSTKLSGCVVLSIAPAENFFRKVYSSFSRREKNFYYEQIEFLTEDRGLHM